MYQHQSFKIKLILKYLQKILSKTDSVSYAISCFLFRPEQRDFLEENLDNQQRSFSHCKFCFHFINIVHELTNCKSVRVA